MLAADELQPVREPFKNRHKEMNERKIITEFGKFLFHTPIAIGLFILELIGAWTVLGFVVDDSSEAAVVISFMFVILISQYLLFRKMYIETEALPNLSFDQIRKAQMHSPSVILGRSTPTYVPVQLWFKNSPAYPTESSIAKSVTAKVSILNEAKQEHLSYYGQWADSNAPDNVGFNGILDSLDIPPGHLRAKLLLALKYPNDDDAFAFTREGFRSSSDGRSLRYRIPPGNYSVNIQLAGVGVNKDFTFTLKNNGAGSDLIISRI
jgi:hypothetical protein